MIRLSPLTRVSLATLALLFTMPTQPSAGGSSPKRAKAAAAQEPGTARRTRARCRDIFCTAHHVALDDAQAAKKNTLTVGTVRALMIKQQPKLEPCIVNARRRDPNLRRVLIEFVVNAKGRVLATRVNAKRRSGLARCVHKHLRRARFPRSAHPRTIASFELRIAH